MKNKTIDPPEFNIFFCPHQNNKCPPSPENGAAPRGGQIEGGDRPPKMGTRFNCEHCTLLYEKNTIDPPELRFFCPHQNNKCPPSPENGAAPRGGQIEGGDRPPKMGTRFNCEHSYMKNKQLIPPNCFFFVLTNCEHYTLI